MDIDRKSSIPYKIPKCHSPSLISLLEIWFLRNFTAEPSVTGWHLIFLHWKVISYLFWHISANLPSVTLAENQHSRVLCFLTRPFITHHWIFFKTLMIFPQRGGERDDMKTPIMPLNILLRNIPQGEEGARQLREGTMYLQRSEQMKRRLTIPTQSMLLSEETSQTFPFPSRIKQFERTKPCFINSLQ